MLDRRYPELLVHEVDTLRTKSRQREHRGDAGRKLMRQFIQHRQVLAVGDDGDLLGQILADAGQFFQLLARGQHIRDVARQITDQPRRLAMGTDTKWIRTLDIEQVGNLFKLTGNFGIDHWHGGSIQETAMPRLDLSQAGLLPLWLSTAIHNYGDVLRCKNLLV